MNHFRKNSPQNAQKRHGDAWKSQQRDEPSKIARTESWVFLLKIQMSRKPNQTKIKAFKL